jgi:two-component system, NtrC family, sensor histidine kinase PilS
MPGNVTVDSQFDAGFKDRVRYLIFGRLALDLLIFFGGFWWISTYTAFRLDTIPFDLAILFLVSVALAAIYFIWMRSGKGMVWQVRTQFLIDALLITWLVRGTGDLISPYITLYIILICVAGFYLGKGDVLFVAASCAISFGVLSLLTSPSPIYSITADVEPTRAIQVIAFRNIAAMLLVGLLAGRLADRRKLRDELQKAEADFADLNVLHERILSSIKSGLITTDLQGKVRAFNRAAEELTGVKSADAIGQSVLTIFGEELRPPIELSLSGVQNIEFTPPNFEAAIGPAMSGNGDGPKRTVACSVSPLVGRSGGVNGLIIAFRDTTEIHAMLEELRRADRLSAVGRMAAGLAHEIRNPLGSISSAVQFLSEKNSLEDETGTLMDVVVRESERLNSIISDFLAYARPEPEKIKRKITNVDAGEAVGDCIALLKHDPAVCDKHIFDFTNPDPPLMIETDEVHLKQVIWNLLRNSIHAMPDGGTLSVRLDQPNPSFVRLVFADDGCGISEAALENIYEPFQAGAHGTGLGLSIVHRIVTEDGGRIDVESKKNIGTTITVELPKKYAQTFDR